MGNKTKAKTITHSNTPMRMDFFLYLSTAYFSNLETIKEAIKLKTQKKTTSIKLYLPAKKVVKKEMKLVKHTVKVAVAAVRSLGIPISSHLGVKITPPPNPNKPPITPAITAALLVF